MRKILLSIFIVLSISSFAQNDTTKYFNSVDYGWRYNRVKAKLALVLPVDTVANKLVGSVVLLNDVFYIKTTSAWTTLSTSISTLTLGSGLLGTSYNGSAAVTAKVDTSLISTKANVTASLIGYAPNALVVKYTDTASMLGNYVRTSNYGITKTGQAFGVDTSTISTKANVLAQVTGYTKYSDTATMLSGYKTFYPRVAISLTTTGTTGAATYNNGTGVLNIPNYATGGGGISLSSLSALNPILYNNTTGVFSADTNRTVGALVTGGSLNKVRDSVYGVLNASKLNITDSVLANRITADRVFVNASLPLKLNVSDSALLGGTNYYNKTYIDANLALKGTVSSVATNTGSGITGGTITTTGTIAADTTTVLATKARLTASLIGYAVNALVMKYTDSATMLTPYVRTSNYGITKTSQAFGVDTSAMSTKANVVALLTGYTAGALVVKYTDTAAMLSTRPNITYITSNLATKLNASDSAVFLGGKYYNKTYIDANLATKQPVGSYLTSVGVTTANGISGSSSGSTTPSLTLSLGAITPTSVNSVVLSGSTTPTLAVTGTSSISGSNTGDNAVNTLYSGLATSKVNVSDTSTMLGNYLRTANWGTIKTGQALGVDSTLLSTKANVVASLLGYTPMSRSLTINGTAQDLTANRTWTVTANTTNALTMNNGGAGAVSGTTFNGSAAQTISYNTIGASPLAGSSSITTVGTLSSGSIPYSLLSGTIPTWNQSTTGNAATATNATTWNGQIYGGTYTTGTVASMLVYNSTSSDWRLISSIPIALSSTITTVGTLSSGSIPYSLLTGTPSLTGYVPYTGATGAVNLGANNLIAGNIGIGGTPSTNTLTSNYLDLTGGASLFGAATTTYLTNNLYYNTNWTYKTTNGGSILLLGSDGSFNFYTAPSGTLNTTATVTNRMILNQAGSLTLGSTSGTGTGSLYAGSGTFSGAIQAETQSKILNASGVAQLNIDGQDASFSVLGYMSNGSIKWLMGNNGNTAGNKWSIGTATGLSTWTDRLAIDFSTGAATFSSSVTASSLIKSGGTSSQYLMADGSVNTTTATTSTSGTYTPTYTNQANTSAITGSPVQWSRIGNVVTVSGKMSYTVTTSGLATSVSFTLPVASLLTNGYDLVGNVNVYNTTSTYAGGAVVVGGTGGMVTYVAPAAGAQTAYYTYQYLID